MTTVPKRYDTVERLKQGLLNQLRIERDNLPTKLGRRVDKAIDRTRRIVTKLDTVTSKRGPDGKLQIRKMVRRSSQSAVRSLDKATRPRTRKRKVVGE